MKEQLTKFLWKVDFWVHNFFFTPFSIRKIGSSFRELLAHVANPKSSPAGHLSPTYVISPCNPMFSDAIVEGVDNFVKQYATPV